MTKTAQTPPKAVQKQKSSAGSTQSFTEIDEIRERYVLLKGGNAAVLIEVKATNFALLSKEEQRIKLLSYASLLNSLSFPIQIVIRSKRIDVSSYLHSIDEQAKNIPFATIEGTQREKIASYILHYKAFIEEMTKVNTVLDKKFYIVIPYSSLELGAAGALKKDDIFEAAKANLKTKADSLITQIGHLSLRARILEEKELGSLFYELFNSQDPPREIESAFTSTTVGGKP